MAEPEAKVLTTQRPATHAPDLSSLKEEAINLLDQSLIHPPSLNCSEIKFGSNFPATVIHSFMGAGNTWLRHLIEQATGFYTGSAFSDKALFKQGFKGELVKPDQYHQVIGVKTHNLGDAEGERKMFQHIRVNKNYVTKCVILIRNPFDTFIAEFNRLMTKSHTASLTHLTDEKYVELFRKNKEVNSWFGMLQKRKSFKRWLASYKDSINQCRYQSNKSKKSQIVDNATLPLEKLHSYHLVFYEDLKRNTVAELKKIAIYLQEYDATRFENCVEQNPEFLEGSFHRKNHQEVDPFRG